MRKLNTKNKTYIGILTTFVIIVFIITGIFVYYKITDMNIKYDVLSESYLYNRGKELIYVDNDTISKRDFLGRYYVLLDGKKVYMGSSSVIYNKRNRNVQLLGTFYEVLSSGEVEKLKGESIISCTEKNRIFKISDRNYLIVGPNLKSTDGLVNPVDYILIELDKVGNGYLYNKDMNIKSFKDLEIDTGDFKLMINDERLIYGDVEINLADINGSTNEYAEKKKGSNQAAGEGSGNGGGSSDNPIGGNGDKPGPKTPEVIKTEKYVARKTSIVNTTTTTDSIIIDYVVYDPFAEYKGLYAVLFDSNGTRLGNYEMDMSLTEYTIEDLKSARDYRVDFYYIYSDDNGNNHETLFDTVNVQTKNFNAHISLEMVSDSSVRYMLKVDSGYVLDSASVELSMIDVDGNVVSTKTHNLTKTDLTAAASNDGFLDTFEELEFNGVFAKLTLKNCVYKGDRINIDASYKFII